MSDINRIILEDQGVDNPDGLFTDAKPNENAKYFPKFLNNAKKVQKTLVNNLDLKSILKINPTKIKGTNISIDANKDELDADNFLRKTGRLK